MQTSVASSDYGTVSVLAVEHQDQGNKEAAAEALETGAVKAAEGAGEVRSRSEHHKTARGLGRGDETLSIPLLRREALKNARTAMVKHSREVHEQEKRINTIAELHCRNEI